MAGTLVYAGEKTVGGALPLYPLFAASISAAVPPILADLQIKLAGLAQLTAGFAVTPPSLTASLAAAIALLASLNATIALTPPSLDISGALALGFAAKVQIIIDAIEKALSVVKQLDPLTDAAGVNVFLYEGTLDGMLVANIEKQIGDAGIDLAAPIYVPIFVVDASAAPTTQALQKSVKLST